MKVTLKLSRVGMNMQEATIAKWHKQVGDLFEKGEALYEIETEKVTREVTAPCNGKVLEILVQAGDNAEVNAGVCVVETST
jgi:pyruvate/2-oxoglutarate dehydrogenase complex dihydrolipoamide acyltransferase (E2) component